MRIFYNVDENGGGGAAENVVKEAPVSIARLMATEGKKVDANTPEMVIDIPAVKEEKPAEEEKPTAKVEESKPAEKPASETPQEIQKPVTEPIKEEKQPIVAATEKAPTLDEVLKNNQLDAILKAKGFDDEKTAFVSQLEDIDPKMIGILQAYKQGTLGNYVKELSIDYAKMEPEEVMRHQLRIDYPKANQKQLEILYKKEVVDAYNLDSDDPQEVEEGKELLSAKADNYRDKLIENQQKYLMPLKPEPKQEKPPVSQEDIQRQQQEQVALFRNELSKDPFVQSIVTSKKITLGEGDEEFNYPVDPDELFGLLTDGKKWASALYDGEEGNYVAKAKHQMLIAAFAKDGEKFLKEYGMHYKAIGAKSVTDKIENPSDKTQSKAAKTDAAPKSAAAAMAREGVIRNGYGG